MIFIWIVIGMGLPYYFKIIDRVGKAEWVGTPLENTITINSTFQYDLRS